MAQANSYFEAGQLEKAEVEYLNVLSLQPTHHLATRRLAEIYYNLGKPGPATRYWQTVSARDTNDLEARIKLGGLSLKGTNQLARDNAIFVLDREPTNEQALILLVDASQTEAQLADTQERLLRLQDKLSNQAAFHVAWANVHMKQTNTFAAEDALQKARSLDENSAMVQKAWAEFYWQQGELTNADTSFRRAVELAGPGSSIPLRYAEFKLSNDAMPEAKKILVQALDKVSDRAEAWIRLARIAFLEQNYEECESYLQKIADYDPDNDQPRLWRARLQQAKGNTDQAIKLLEELQRDYPKVADVYLQLGLAHYQKGDQAAALSNLRQALTLNPNLSQAILLSAELNISLGDPGLAVSQLRNLIQRKPELDRAHLLLALAYNAQGRVQDGLAVLKEISKRFPTNASIAFLEGASLRQLKRNAEAREAFQRAQELGADNLTTINALIDLDLGENKHQAAQERAGKFLAENPNSALAYFLQAKVQLAVTNYAEAKKALQKTIELDPNSGPAYALLTTLNLKTGQSQEAIAEVERMLAKDPADVRALMLLASICERTSQEDKAIGAYDEVIKANPKQVTALNNLAYLLTKKGVRGTDALAYADQARALAPAEAGIADTLGWVYYKRGEYNRALALLNESAAKLADQAEVQSHLGMAAYMMGQEERARLVLKRALELSPSFTGREDVQRRLSFLESESTAPEPANLPNLEKLRDQYPNDLMVLLRLARCYQRVGSPEKALGAYEAARKINPNSAQVLVELATLYFSKLNDPANALAVAREARRLAPEDPHIAHILGRSALEQGDAVWATSLLQESAAKLSKEPEVFYDLAQAVYSLGRVQEAAEALRKARQNGAISADQDAQWFSALIEFQNSPEKRLAAEGQVQQLLKRKPNLLPALMVAGLIHEQRGKVAEARQTYEGILQNHPRFAPAKKRLAELWSDKLNDQQKALDYAIQAREVLIDDPELAKTLGKIAYRRNDFSTALRYLQESSRKLESDAELQYFLGLTHRALKDKAQSRKALDRALVLAPDAPFAAEAKKALAEMN